MPYNKDILGWMTENELKVLEKIALTVPKNGIVVEVGSMFGKSAACWAMTCDPSVTIYCIDIFPDEYIQQDTGYSEDICLAYAFPSNGKIYRMYDLFLENTQNFENLIHIRGDSPKEIIYPGCEIDVFFLDAGHSNPNDWENIEYFVPFVKAGGMISGHDYSSVFPDVVENVKRLEGKLNTPVTLYPNSSIWSFTLKNKIEVGFEAGYLMKLVRKVIKIFGYSENGFLIR